VSRRPLGLCLLLALALAAGCGGNESAIERMEERLGDSQRGEMLVELVAADGDTTRAGMRIEGVYAYDGPGPYAILDVRYVRFAGANETASRVVSTGTEVFVEADGAIRRLNAAEAAPLLLGDGDPATEDLGIAGWVVGERSVERGGAVVVTGRVDAGDLLTDLARVMGGVTGARVVAPDETAADRLARLVRRSHFRAVGDRDAGDLRSIDASVEFRARARPALVESLGELANAKLDVQVRHRPIPGRVEVAPPT
jgi:hypothetical protein